MRMVDRCSGSGVEQREDGMMGVNNLEETWEMFNVRWWITIILYPNYTNIFFCGGFTG